LDEIEKYINYIVLINNGRIYFQGAWEHNTGTLRNKYDQFIKTGSINQFYETISDVERYKELHNRGLITDRDMLRLSNSLRSTDGKCKPKKLRQKTK
jgi:ABC-type multidrug transport system ATPase subunit